MKVGDYVRTYSGFIGKVEYIETDEFGSSTYYFEKTFTEKCDKVKLAKEKLIDLIEVGDYVNGYKVIDFMLENGKIKGIIVDADIWGFDIDEIKSIVTHEQFSSMEYKVESEVK